MKSYIIEMWKEGKLFIFYNKHIIICWFEGEKSAEWEMCDSVNDPYGKNVSRLKIKSKRRS